MAIIVCMYHTIQSSIMMHLYLFIWVAQLTQYESPFLTLYSSCWPTNVLVQEQGDRGRYSLRWWRGSVRHTAGKLSVAHNMTNHLTPSNLIQRTRPPQNNLNLFLALTSTGRSILGEFASLSCMSDSILGGGSSLLFIFCRIKCFESQYNRVHSNLARSLFLF